MSTPKTASAAIRQTVRALRAAGYVLDSVYDGSETVVKYPSEDSVISAVHNADGDAYLYVHAEGCARGPWVRFVIGYGNLPEESINDYTTDLEHVLGPLTDAWLD